jgi:hypothetical protein
MERDVIVAGANLGRNTNDDSPHPETYAATRAVLNHSLGPVAVMAE